ncbi:MAG: hypothetical protein ABJC74_15275 [Gemmatimonadota bacterium]
MNRAAVRHARRATPTLGPALLVALMLLAPARGSAQISPGPLAKPHASLEGALNCTRCHGTRNEALPGQCVACHKEIGWLVAQRRGLHALEGRTACASCHPEHAGNDFALVAWNADSLARFDHRRAGWVLEGAHRTLACEKCHQTVLRVSPAARLLPSTRSGPGYLGLERSCASCHIDVHKGGLGQTCTDCHGMDRWKPAPRFNHASTSYPLTGAHGQVACAKCHQDPRWATARDSSGAPAPVYKPVPHAQCSACHSDPHSGKFGGGCAECHQTRSFSVIDGSSFNHSRTRYPLAGKHTAVACAACHELNGVKRKDPPFTSCGSCHTDAHNGLATISGKPVDCAACHTPQGYLPSTFTVAQHHDSKYPLEGKHQAVGCGSCHIRVKGPAGRAALGASLVQMRPSARVCTDCHAPDHGQQLAGRPDGGQCSGCHTVNGWRPTSFGVTDHARFSFTLTGRHATTGCRDCHGLDRKGLPALPATVSSTRTLGRAGLLFKIPERDCTDCHVDSHRGRLAAQQAGGIDGRCTACHDSERFRPSTIDVAAHSRYGFRLDGAHGAVPCTACHAAMAAPRPAVSLIALRQDGGAAWLFPTKGKSCVSCHRSPHGDQFASRADKGACEACHGTDGFTPANRFDHGRDTGFPLTGGHAAVPCAKCHQPAAGTPDPSRIRYRAVSAKCENCHGGAMPKPGGA